MPPKKQVTIKTYENQWALYQLTGLWITQVNCHRRSPIMAPTGCVQYYVGEKGVVKSFNFEGLQYFVDQDIRICIKPERGHCNIQFEAEANQFMISVKLFSQGNFFLKN